MDPNSIPDGMEQSTADRASAFGVAESPNTSAGEVGAELTTEGALALKPAEPEREVTREQRRSRRKREVRARTISVKRMTKRELELGRLLYPDVEDAAKPKERVECGNGERPCPFV